jgi:general stress protein YciG
MCCATEVPSKKETSIMAGTKAGGKAAAATNKAKYGADFYSRIGAEGGKKGRTGGFFANRELARIAGARGGRISRRVKKTA